MSGSVTPAPAGFFQGFQVNEQTAADLVSATANALTAANTATASATSAATAATTATTAANNAASSLASIGSSVTSASNSASAAAASAAGASTSSTNAAASATAASGSASSATASASTATGAASTATTQAGIATTAASAASGSASAASASATSAASSAATAMSYGSGILNNSALTGVPTAPTAGALTNNTQVSTTAYADTAVGVEKTRALAAEALLAPKASPALTGTPTAPTAAALTNTTQLATTAFTTAADTVVTAQAMENVGRNLFHNGEFLVNQRGLGAFTTGAPTYTSDRWLQNIAGAGNSTTIGAAADADRTAIGDEAVVNNLVVVAGGSAGSGDFVNVGQRLESVQRYGGKTLTVSFWAKASAGTPNLGVGAAQVFGTGGSPSATVDINATLVVLSTTWTRYSVHVVLPTTIGKTLGTTAGSDFVELKFWLSSGSTHATIAGSPGIQAFTLSLWGMQAEVGTVATTFEKKSYGQHLADCQRFYQLVTGGYYSWTGAAANAQEAFTPAAPMRVIPTVVGFTSSQAINVPATGSYGIVGTANAFSIGDSRTMTAAAATVWSGTYQLSADL